MAGYSQSLTTGHRYVTAIVDPGQGWVQVKLYPGRPQDGTLSYSKKSFVTFFVNGTYYTNNDVGLTPFPPNAQHLTDGVLSKIGDTIRCVWPNKNGVDLIQEVYPVLFERSEQIVFKWKAFNKTGAPIPISVQYLLDVQVGDQSYINDGAPILTRYGYRPIWDQFTRTTNQGIPWFYIAFQYALPNSPTFDPGISGQGYLDNVNFNLGLTQPWRQTIGDWNQLIQVEWGPPAPLPSGNYADAATLLEFDASTALSNKEVQIARTSYGTGEFAVCKGQVFAVVFYPLRIKWQPPNLVPNPFNVEMYAFNPQTVTGAPNTKISLTVGPYLTITKPDTGLTNGGKSQMQITSGPGGPGNIPPLGVGQCTWTVQADKITNCNGDLMSFLKFYCISPGLGYPIFVNEADGTDTCEHPIIIECANMDLLPPIIDSPFVRVDTFTTKFTVHDDRPITDKGLKSITWVAAPGTDSTKFDVSFTPAIIPCPTDNKKHTITVVQKDSTIGGCIDFTFEDCVGNRSDTSVCFSAHAVPAHPDTLPPIIQYVERLHKYDSLSPDCNFQIDSLIATDNRQYDHGLLSISVVGTPVNMQLRSLNVQPGDRIARFAVMVIDSMKNGSITVRAEDIEHHTTDSTYIYCTIADTAKPIVTINHPTRTRWDVEVWDGRPWDRLIDSIAVLNMVNVRLPAGMPNRIAAGTPDYKFEVDVIDSIKESSFCVEAVDSALNWSQRICVQQGIDSDIYYPNISYVPPPSTNPTKITVSINDIHLDANGDTIRWDRGIDSVWFTNVNGIVLPTLNIKGCPKIPPTFDLSVRDTLDVDSTACVTIWARDCARNIAPPVTWCYPYHPDLKSPVITGNHIGRTEIDFTVTDSALYDRGLSTINLIGETNLTPPVNIYANRDPEKPVSLTRSLNTSSYGTLEAIDYWGSLSPSSKDQHTASIDFGVWVQDLAMTQGFLLTKSGPLTIPVFLVKTDSFSIDRKGIREFDFTFTINGDVNSLQFNGVDLTGTLSGGWTVTSTPTGNTYRIHGVSGGPVLADPSDTLSQPLVLLMFTATRDESIRDITVDINQVNGETVVYNGGIDTVLTGKNATVTLPAPYGSLTGSHIVIPGTCTPSVATGSSHPTIVTLDQNRPNPFTGVTTFRYTIKEEGLVKITVFDMLGNEIVKVFDGVQSQGTYEFTFNGSKYMGGSYVVRLEASGEKLSRRMLLEK
jgi:hypothetical protein